jgi:hypothetical protein
MSDLGTTPFSKKCEILGDLWLEYRQDESFQDFFEYSDLGVPIAYGIQNKLIEKLTSEGTRIVEESFRLLLAGLSVEDTGFDSLEDLLEIDE